MWGQDMLIWRWLRDDEERSRTSIDDAKPPSADESEADCSDSSSEPTPASEGSTIGLRDRQWSLSPGTSEEAAEPAGSQTMDADDTTGETSTEGSEALIEQISMPGETDPEEIVEQLLGSDTPRRDPAGAALISEIDRQSYGTLLTVAEELRVRRRDTQPLLVGIPHHSPTVAELLHSFDTVLLVESNKREYLPILEPYLPALFTTQTGAVGSARVIERIDVSEDEPDSTDVQSELRAKKGEPLHHLAEVEYPELYAFAAPSEFHDVTRRALDDLGSVIYALETDAQMIQVVGFTFAEDEPDQASSRRTRGRYPTGRYPPNSGTPDSGAETDGGDTASTTGGGSTQPTESQPSFPGTGPEPSGTPDADGDRPSGSAGQDRPPDNTTSPSPDSDGGDHPETDADTDGPDGNAVPDTDTEATPGNGSENDTDSSPSQTTPDGDDEDAGGAPDSQDSEEVPDGEESGTPTESAPPSDSNPTGDDHTPDGTLPDSTSGSQDGGSEPAGRPDSTVPDSDAPGAETDPEADSDSTETDASGGAPDSAVPDSSGSGRAPSSSPPTEQSGGDETVPPSSDPDAGGSAPTGGSGSSPPQGSSGGAGAEPAGQSPVDTPPSSTPPGNDTSKSPGHDPSTDESPDLPGVPTGPPGSDSDDDSGGRAPDTGFTPDAPPEYRPGTVAVTEHVLNEFALHAGVHAQEGDETEVYGTVYANPDGVIRYYNPVDSEEYVLRNGNSVTFKPSFYSHLKELACHHKEVNHRLCGDVHSHPGSGIPRQSPADKTFNKRIWRNARNTEFIVGVDDGTGPDDWTRVEVDDGVEVRKQLNGNLIRIRAYSGENDPKDIEILRTMGG